MKKLFSGFCALALTATLLTGCGCSNSAKKPNMMPTTIPTTQATVAPTTRPATVPTTMPTTEAPTTEMPGTVPSENGRTATEATGGMTGQNRMPSNNGH